MSGNVCRENHLGERRNGYGSAYQRPPPARRNGYGSWKTLANPCNRRNWYAAEMGTPRGGRPHRSGPRRIGYALHPHHAETGTPEAIKDQRYTARRTRFCGDNRVSSLCLPPNTPDAPLSAQKRVRKSTFSCGKACENNKLSPQKPVRALR